MLEGFCHDFSRIERRSIGRKSEATELFKGSIEAKLTTRREKETGHLSSFPSEWFSSVNHRNFFSRLESCVIAGYQIRLHPRNNISVACVQQNETLAKEILVDASLKNFFYWERFRCKIANIIIWKSTKESAHVSNINCREDFQDSVQEKRSYWTETYTKKIFYLKILYNQAAK